MHFQKKRKNFKWINGFTATEIVTTVAIISIVSSFAIPNFLRLQKNTNMEMVRQNMKAIGEKMTEIFVTKGAFPDKEDFPFTDSLDPDEQCVTASLSAIDSKGYTTLRKDYKITDDRQNYSFTTYPKDPRFGGKAFTISMGGLEEEELSDDLYAVTGDLAGNTLAPWLAPDGTYMEYMGDTTFSWPISQLLADSALNQQQKTTLLTQLLELQAYNLDMYANMDLSSPYLSSEASQALQNSSYSTFIVFSGEDAGVYNQLLSSVYQNLLGKGIQLQIAERSLEYARDYQQRYRLHDLDRQLNAIANPMVLEVVFVLNDRVETGREFLSRYSQIGHEWLDYMFAHPVR